MPHFKENDIVPFWDEVQTVLKMEACIGHGNQADVYSAVDILQNRMVAAKHCYGNYASDRERFYEKVAVLTRHPSPHPDLCWPEKISQLTKNKSFIYTMPLLKGYHSITGIINRTDKLTTAQKAALLGKIADIFHALHRRGFVYGDISAENILYRIEADGSVSVKIIDCENVTLPGFSLGLEGSGKYRAPELLLPDPDREDGRPQPPSVQSDCFAFQVLAFRVLLRRHPLDGALARTAAADDHEGFLEHYARHPRFIFDGTANDPGPRVTRNWKLLPLPMQVYFADCFSQKSLHDKRHRTGMEEFKTFLAMSYSL